MLAPKSILTVGSSNVIPVKLILELVSSVAEIKLETSIKVLNFCQGKFPSHTPIAISDSVPLISTSGYLAEISKSGLVISFSVTVQ